MYLGSLETTPFTELILTYRQLTTQGHVLMELHQNSNMFIQQNPYDDVLDRILAILLKL